MTSTSIYTPFTYCLTFLLTGQRYYGVRYANNKKEMAHPSQLWTTYFTSSETIKALIEEYGEDSFTFEIRKTFKTREQACSWETKFLTKIDAAKHPEWLNGHNGSATFCSTPKSVQKMRATIKQNNSLLTAIELSSKYGRKGKDNSNYKGGIGFNSYHYCPLCNISVISDSAKCCIKCMDRTGVNNPFYGKTHSKETLEKLRISNIGRTKSQYEIDAVSGENSGKFKGYYHTPWGTFPAANQAKAAHSYMSVVTITRWCEYPDNDIVRLGASKYLQEIGLSAIGKTYRELGFSFTPK